MEYWIREILKEPPKHSEESRTGLATLLQIFLPKNMDCGLVYGSERQMAFDRSKMFLTSVTTARIKYFRRL